jgi:hypothetical protein
MLRTRHIPRNELLLLAVAAVVVGVGLVAWMCAG